MSDLALFMSDNKKKTENQFYAPTKSLCDENGEPLKWEFKPLSSEEYLQIQRKYSDIQNPETVNIVDISVAMICAMVVHPPLNSSSLQDSYGVRTPEKLLLKLVDDADEFDALAAFVNNFSGYGSADKLREEVKNS